ncbi:MAG: hypothetical protein FWB80_13355 [Defluviitaleaceae bacterium]|nr:hypothetical protein [Defluviitaleaceae bacterium]
MTDTMQTSAILSAGMKLLRENLGLIETEIFIVSIKNKGFDYTAWRENLWENMTSEELFAKAAEFERHHPELMPKNAKRI